MELAPQTYPRSTPSRLRIDPKIDLEKVAVVLFYVACLKHVSGAKGLNSCVLLLGAVFVAPRSISQPLLFRSLAGQPQQPAGCARTAPRSPGLLPTALPGRLRPACPFPRHLPRGQSALALGPGFVMWWAQQMASSVESRAELMGQACAASGRVMGVLMVDSTPDRPQLVPKLP